MGCTLDAVGRATTEQARQQRGSRPLPRARLRPPRRLRQHEHLAIGPELARLGHLLAVSVKVQLLPVLVAGALKVQRDTGSPPQEAQAAPLRRVAAEDAQGAARPAAGDELLGREPFHQLREVEGVEKREVRGCDQEGVGNAR